MKRSFLVSLMIGLPVAIIVIALHATGLLSPLELAGSKLLAHDRAPAGSTGILWQAPLVVLFAVGISWLTLTSLRRGRIAWVAGILLFEFAALSWICALY